MHMEAVNPRTKIGGLQPATVVGRLPTTRRIIPTTTYRPSTIFSHRKSILKTSPRSQQRRDDMTWLV